MFEKSIPVIVQAAVRTELTNARKTYGDLYANAHEGFGVLYEEYHEAASEMRDLESLIREQLIEDLHENDDQAIIDTLADAEVIARNLACEAIQVAAVVCKMRQTVMELKKEGRKDG